MKKTIFLLVLCSMLVITGCSGSDSEEKQGESEMEDRMDLTQEKKDFLAAMSMDEERVQDGKLYEWQREVLYQYDYAMEYLQQKYPSHTFHFTSCNPKGKNENFSTFWFETDGGVDSYELYLYVDDNGEYRCEDNFYGALIKDSYNDALLSLLKERVPECIGVACDFNTVQGADFGEQLTGQEILEGDDKISNTTYIYVVQPDESQAQTLVETLQDVITEKNIYGSYYVEVLNSDPDSASSGDELKACVQEQESQDVILEQKFNVFD